MKIQAKLTPVLFALTLAAAPALQAKPIQYQIDTSGMHASINFKIQHLGYSWLTGRFEQFSGQYTYDSEQIGNSHIQINIDTSSVNSNHAERDKHLRSADFLNVKKFPQAKFVSSRISGSDQAIKVEGQLTLNGVTRPITLQAHKIGEGKDPWGGYRSGFSGLTELKLADFNIQKNLGPASANVLLELNIEGIKK